ncbi:MAG: endolytic transglycosylase MltG [Candidatus Berkelbacteria bacterium]|nr:endolytic transglycosylase MltG [Candidatus Berkelbacteria bacterium]
MKRIIISATISVVALIILGYAYFLFQAPNRTQTQAIPFEIKPNTSSVNIALELKNKNLIRSKWLFLICLKVKRGEIQAGTYELSYSSTLLSILRKLTSGQIKQYEVTFPEGYSIKDMATELEKKQVVKKEDFLNETSQVGKYSQDFSFLKDIKTQNLEGYLFPDTYRFPLKVTSEDIIRTMLKNFDTKVISKIDPQLKQQGKTLNEVIIMSSIVEREAKKEEDRAKIASVYLNRLAKNMKLEADPTIQYAKGDWELINAADYQAINSPYNTYKYAGLSPGPICNPGLASILAVLNPEKTDYLYFFHTKDGSAYCKACWINFGDYSLMILELI